MRRRYKILLWVVIGIWAIAMSTLVAPMLVRGYYEKNAVLAQFSEYSASLVNRHFDLAYQHCGSEFRKAMSYDQFVKLYGDLERQYGTLKTVTQQGYEVHGTGSPVYWTAVIDADFVYEKKTLRFEFALHKSGNGWVIFGFQPA